MSEKKTKKKHNDFNDNDRLRKMLVRAIAGETADFAFYNNMANMVEDHELKTIILGVAGDEYGHARTFRTMLNMFPHCVKTRDEN